jgi:hypothetical protein
MMPAAGWKPGLDPASTLLVPDARHAADALGGNCVVAYLERTSQGRFHKLTFVHTTVTFVHAHFTTQIHICQYPICKCAEILMFDGVAIKEAGGISIVQG